MRYAVLLLSSVLIGGTFAVAQTAPAAAPTTSGNSQAMPAPPPLHPITDAQAKELLHLTGAVRLGRQSMARMMAYLRGVVPPYIPQDVMVDMQTSMEKIDLASMMTKIYQEHISQKDAAAIIAFYKTPAGQDLLKEMPAIAKESQEAGLKAGQQVAHDVLQRHKAEILAAAKKYQAAQSSSQQP
jgi:hypothetical protein